MTISGSVNAKPRDYTLYRMFDTGGRLLYVGLTIDPPVRFRTHRATKDWWREIAVIQLERFPNHETLREAERTAITNELPKYNITYNVTIGSNRPELPELCHLKSIMHEYQELEQIRAERDKEIAALVARNVPREPICDIVGLTREQVRRIA